VQENCLQVTGKTSKEVQNTKFFGKLSSFANDSTVFKYLQVDSSLYIHTGLGKEQDQTFCSLP